MEQVAAFHALHGTLAARLAEPPFRAPEGSAYPTEGGVGAMADYHTRFAGLSDGVRADFETEVHHGGSVDT